MNPQLGGIEIDDRIAHELSWAVVGDIAAAIGLVEGNALGFELGVGREHMPGGVWSAGDGDDRGVLDHQYPSRFGIGGVSGIKGLGCGGAAGTRRRGRSQGFGAGYGAVVSRGTISSPRGLALGMIDL